MSMGNRRVISNLTEIDVAFCKKCDTARELEVKQLKDGHLILVCSKCGYRDPVWKIK